MPQYLISKTRYLFAILILALLAGSELVWAVGKSAVSVDIAKCHKPTNSDVAINYCTQAIESGQLSGKGLAFAFYRRGNGYHEKGDYDRAILDYDQAVRLNPSHANAFSNRGVAYARKGDYDRAIQDYDEAIRLNPNHADAFSNRGVAYGARETTTVIGGLVQVRHPDEVGAPRAVQLRLGAGRATAGPPCTRRCRRRGHVAPASPQASAITFDRLRQNGWANATCATRPRPKNVDFLPRVRSMNWSGTTMCSGAYCSFSEPTADTDRIVLDAEPLHREHVRLEVQLVAGSGGRGRGAAGRPPAGPRERPTSRASEGSPNGVSTRTSRTSVKPSIW